jgi:hypothetical protein
MILERWIFGKSSIKLFLGTGKKILQIATRFYWIKKQSWATAQPSLANATADAGAAHTGAHMAIALCFMFGARACTRLANDGAVRLMVFLHCLRVGALAHAACSTEI